MAVPGGPVFVCKTGWDLSDESVTGWILERNRYHFRVLDSFKHHPQDLLVVNFIRDRAAARKISEFIGRHRVEGRPHVRPIPKSREAGILRNRAQIERCLRALSVCRRRNGNRIYIVKACWKTPLTAPGRRIPAPRACRGKQGAMAPPARRRGVTF